MKTFKHGFVKLQKTFTAGTLAVLMLITPYLGILNSVATASQFPLSVPVTVPVSTPVTPTPTSMPTATPTPSLVKASAALITNITPARLDFYITNGQNFINSTNSATLGRQIEVYEDNSGRLTYKGKMVDFCPTGNVTYLVRGGYSMFYCYGTTVQFYLKGLPSSFRMRLPGYTTYSGKVNFYIPTPTATPTPIKSVIKIYAAGSPAFWIYPKMQLLINDQLVQEWSNVRGNAGNREFIEYTYTANTKLNASQIKVRFPNDAGGMGQDRNLVIDKIVLNSVDYQSEAASTYSNWNWNEGTGWGTGFKKSEILYTNNAYFQYGMPYPTNTPTPTVAPTATPTVRPTVTPTRVPTPTPIPTLPPIHTGAFNISLSNQQTSITCKVGDRNCYYSSSVRVTNRTNKNLYNTTAWVSPFASYIGYYSLDGNGFIANKSTLPRTLAPGGGFTTWIKVQPVFRAGTYFATLYIDGKTCNTQTTPWDCVYYGASSLTITVKIVN